MSCDITKWLLCSRLNDPVVHDYSSQLVMDALSRQNVVVDHWSYSIYCLYILQILVNHPIPSPMWIIVSVTSLTLIVSWYWNVHQLFHHAPGFNPWECCMLLEVEGLMTIVLHWQGQRRLYIPIPGASLTLTLNRWRAPIILNPLF